MSETSIAIGISLRLFKDSLVNNFIFSGFCKLRQE